jgi:hypothetical protein
MSSFESENLLVTTFSYEPWQISAAIEIINVETSNNNVTWLDLNRTFGFKSKYPFSDALDSLIKKNGIKRKFINGNFLYYNQKSEILSNLLSLQLNTNPSVKERAKEIAYMELISELRDSAPCRKHYASALQHYEKIFLQTFNYMHRVFQNNFYNKVYIFNGRNLQERAAWDAAIANNITINFYESFNEYWTDRYFIFKEPTHSPKYRSEVMLNYSKMEKDKNADAYAKIANKWFIDRQNGISQNYTKLQNKSQTVTFNNPYFVFFHSSQDELDMLGLISKYWKNQVNSLSALIDIFKINSRFNLVLRIHPHLLYKSKIERHYWDEIGLNLQKRYSWFHYIPADSNINSYELIKNSRGIISCASTIGVEAAYLKKKSILLGRAFHEFMGVTQNPKNKEELTRMLFTENEAEEFEKAYESSLAYAYFSEMGGNFFKYVSYRLKYGRKIYEYKGFTISPLFIIRILRVVEEFIGGIFSNKKQGRCLRDCGINTRQGWQ